MYKCNTCNKNFNKSYYYANHLQNHTNNQNYLNNFIKYSLDGIEYINGVPKVVFVCWFGGYGIEMPSMNVGRFNCFKDLILAIEIPVILITYKNYKFFIKDEYPLHKSFQYLTGVHKSDYFRCYLMHHYGGGYHDIKSRNLSWKGEWEKDNWLYDSNIWMYGRMEKNENAIGAPPNMDHIKKEYKKMVTMCWIICKKNTKYTLNLLNRIVEILEQKYDTLIMFPGIQSSGYRNDDRDMTSSYPLRWLEILGEIYHPLMLKYNDHIKFGLPDANKSKRYK